MCIIQSRQLICASCESTLLWGSWLMTNSIKVASPWNEFSLLSCSKAYHIFISDKDADFWQINFLKNIHLKLKKKWKKNSRSHKSPAICMFEWGKNEREREKERFYILWCFVLMLGLNQWGPMCPSLCDICVDVLV